MKRIVCSIALIFAAAFASPALAGDTKKLEQELARIRQKFPGDMAVYMKNLSTGDEIALDAERVYETFIANDAGILWVKDQPIVLVVFTGRHRGQTASLHDAVARVAALIARHYGAALAPDFR